MLDRQWPRAELSGLAPQVRGLPQGNDRVLRVFGEKDGRGRKHVRRIIQLRLSYENGHSYTFISSLTSAHVLPQPPSLNLGASWDPGAPQQVAASNSRGSGCRPSDPATSEGPRRAVAGQDAMNTGPPPAWSTAQRRPGHRTAPSRPDLAPPRPPVLMPRAVAAVPRHCSALTFLRKAIRGRWRCP